MHRLRIHLIGGQTVTLDVTSYEITLPQFADEGHVVAPMSLAYQAARADTLAYLAFAQVSAIEVEPIGDEE